MLKISCQEVFSEVIAETLSYRRILLGDGGAR
jgi:hypothetical protein